MFTALSRNRRIGIVSAGALVATGALLIPAYAMASGTDEPEGCEVTTLVPAGGLEPVVPIEPMSAAELAELDAELAQAFSGDEVGESTVPGCTLDGGTAGG